MVRGLVILLALQFAGEAISSALNLPIPGNVIGMALLFLALRVGAINFESVKEAAELLLSNLALLFVPAGVGVMAYFDLVRREWIPITLSLTLSTFVVMAVTGWTARALARGGDDGGS